MPRLRKKLLSGLRAQAFGLVASASVLASAAPVWAQQAPGLRGAMPSGGTTQAAAAGTSATATNQAATAYTPASDGATADDPAAVDADGSLFPRDASDAGDFAEPAAPASRSPSTARDRRQQREQELQRQAAPAPNTNEAGGIERTGSIDPAERIGVPDSAERVEAIQDIDPVRAEDSPFAPLGIRVGTFILRPSIEQGITTTSNADYSIDGKEAVLSETTLRLNAISDWTHNSATLDAYGTFRESLSGYDISELRAGGLAALNLDLTEELRARATLGYDRAPETAASPVVIEGTIEDPIRQTFSASLGLDKDVGKARFGITGRLEHDAYGDADLSNGDVLSQEDRNSTLATITLRGGYEISPTLTPFVELEGGHRFYQEEVDASGYRRSSDRVGARGGVAIDVSEKLSGELSAGWIREEFEDDRLEPIEGPTLAALVSWSPERGTEVNLSAETIVEGTTTAGESGSILHSGRLSVQREIRSNLTANAAIGAGYRDYSGSDEDDVLFNAEVGATWWLNRYAGLTGRLRYESLSSSFDGRGYDAKSAFLGLTVQR